MPKTMVYEPEFKKRMVQMYLEEGRTIKSLNEEYPFGEGTVRKWVRAFRKEWETAPDFKDTKNFLRRTQDCADNWRIRKRKWHS